LLRASDGVLRALDVSNHVERNIRVWVEGSFANSYASRTLRPAEAVALIRYADALRGDILELGCGTGRITTYLGARAARVTGIDISPEMVNRARDANPDADFAVADLRDLSSYASRPWNAVIASFNVLGVLDDAGRRRVLGELARMIAADGVLYFSAHNKSEPRPYPVTVRTRPHGTESSEGALGAPPCPNPCTKSAAAETS
jgi:SAM-dependent methyltransferase